MGDVQGLQTMVKYAWVKRIWIGPFATIHLMQDRRTQELVAVKFIERGYMVFRHVEEILNHRDLVHPHIVRFKEITATRSHLGIVMEFSGGPPRVLTHYSLPFCEDMARFLFRQLISGVGYIHSQAVCHRTLCLHHCLIGARTVSPGVEIPHLKICDFSGSITSFLRATSLLPVREPQQFAPEIWRIQPGIGNLQDMDIGYNGYSADVWSCGVTLYFMLVGYLPFQLPTDTRMKTTLENILEADYSIPDRVNISRNCRDLLSRMLVADPAGRITIPEIEQHSWVKNQNYMQHVGPAETYVFRDTSPPQSTQEVLRIIGECRRAP